MNPAEAHKYIRQKIGISRTTNEEEAARIIGTSMHAQDYHMDKDFLRDLRVKHVDVLWRRANRDVDSVQAAVRM
jgi:GTP cyclohydrolase II